MNKMQSTRKILSKGTRSCSSSPMPAIATSTMEAIPNWKARARQKIGFLGTR